MKAATSSDKKNMINCLIFGMGITYSFFLAWAILYKCGVPFIGGDIDRAITDYAKKNDIIVVGEYIDRARSAMTDNRPEFLRMITDAAKKDFDVVLVHKLDRFERNRQDSFDQRTKLAWVSQQGWKSLHKKIR